MPMDVRVFPRRFAGTALALGILLSPAAGKALSVTPDPIVFDIIPFPIEISFLGVVDGLPAGGTVLAGSISPGDKTLVFQAEALADYSWGSEIGIQFYSESVSVLAAGTIAGPDVDATSGLLGVRGFGGVDLGSILEGEFSDPFFFTVANLTVGDEYRWAIAHGTAHLNVWQTVVPEPASAVLLLLGLTMLAGRRA